MTDKERIEKEAIEYVIRATGYQVLSEHDHWKEAYIAGATAERQNAWNEALDALIDWAKEERSNMLPTWAASVYDDLIRKIEQLKHKQP